MKVMVWTLFCVACTAMAAWFVLGPGFLRDLLDFFVLALLFVVPSMGTCWMLYQSIRYEKQSLPFVILALVPYAFLWYYFGRYRRRAEAKPIPAAFR